MCVSRDDFGGGGGGGGEKAGIENKAMSRNKADKDKNLFVIITMRSV